MVTDQWVDTRRLYIFCWVADLGSMKAAADTLGLSPSTVSQSVSQLERDVALDLVRGVGRGITITAIGREFADRAKGVLERSMTFQSWVRSLAAQEDRRITIHYLESVGATWLPPVVATMLRRWPDVDIDLVRGDGTLVEPEAGRPTVSLVVTDAESRRPIRPDIASRRLVTEPYVSVSPSTGRPVASSRDLTTLDTRAIITTDSPGTLCHQLLGRAFERVGITDHGWVHVPDTTTAVELAAAGLGVALLPRSASAGLARRKDLSVSDLNPEQLERTVVAQYRLRDAASETVITALEALELAVQESSQ